MSLRIDHGSQWWDDAKIEGCRRSEVRYGVFQLLSYMSYLLSVPYKAFID